MNILIIPSAKIINSELQSRYGKIVPILIPIENGIVLDKLYKKYKDYYDEIVIILHEELENTLSIINSKNYKKIKIKILSELRDIGGGVVEVLKEYSNLNEIKNLSINFGDTLIDNINNYQNKDVICYSKKTEISGKWAYFEKKSGNLLIKEQEIKESEKNNLKNILIGFFNIVCVSKFYTLLLSKKTQEKESLYAALEEYNYDNRINFIIERKWADFGHLYNFLQVKKIVETRFFNEIKIDRNKNILTKKSKEKEKFINEIKWFLTLPGELQWITPRIYSYSLDWKEPKISMEYYSYPTLHHLYLYGNHNFSKWNQIFEKLFYVHKEMKKYTLKLSSEQIEEALNKIYIEKTFERLEKLKEDKNFYEYFQKDFYINDIKIKKIEEIKKILKKLIKILKINIKNELNIIHGDYFFANILYDPTVDIIKVIDPRGDFGGYGIYGDSDYDLAKLAHSVDGMYDFIVEDLFYLEEKKEGFNYEIVCSKKHKKIKELFFSYFTDEQKIKIKFIEALLFLSMIPLHKDKPKRQKVMLGVGMRILYEIIEEKGMEVI